MQSKPKRITVNMMHGEKKINVYGLYGCYRLIVKMLLDHSEALLLYTFNTISKYHLDLSQDRTLYIYLKRVEYLTRI